MTQLEFTPLKNLSLRSIGINLLTLKFRDKATEADFIEYHGTRSLVQARIYFILGLILFSLFGLHDFLLLDNAKFALEVRFGVLLPGLLLLSILTFLPPSKRYIELILFTGMLLGGLGILIIKSYSTNPVESMNYMGIGLVIIFMYTLLPMVFIYALFSGLILAGTWTFFAMVVNPIPHDVLISNMFYIYTCTILGISAGRVREQYARRTFFLMMKTVDEQRHIQKINAELELKVAERTEVLNIINKHLHDEIREKVQTEKELMDAKQRAEESDRMKSAFLANMSHEIRTPMNGILGFAQLLSSPNTNEEKRGKYISIINDNGKLLLKIVDDILDFAKIEAGQLKIEKSVCNIDEVLSRLLATYNVNKVFRRKGNIEIRLVTESGSKPQILYTDGKRLEQVLSNLLDNALKFTEEGSIEFGYRELSPGLLTFHVKDTGIGISEKFENLIFERFNQAEIATKKYGGSGLGLAISKGIIELLGGRIGMNSEPGSGTTFHFTLTVQTDPERNTPISGKTTSQGNYAWKDKVVLVAEDEEINFNLVREILRDSEVNILHARNGREVLDLLHHQVKNIDLILMDIKMPEMNGFEAIEIIRKENTHIPIIAHTAFAMTDERERCLQLGCNDYISKPVNADEFLERLGKYLN
ncbi:MAG: response regulator [Bacteroidales bacterium]